MYEGKASTNNPSGLGVVEVCPKHRFVRREGISPQQGGTEQKRDNDT